MRLCERGQSPVDRETKPALSHLQSDIFMKQKDERERKEEGVFSRLKQRHLSGSWGKFGGVSPKT